MNWGLIVAALITGGVIGYLWGVIRWRGKCIKLQTQIEGKDEAHNEKIAALIKIQDSIQQQLKSIATSALNDNQTQFLGLAGAFFKTHKQNAEEDLGARQKAVEALVAPINQSLKDYKTQIDELEKARATAFGSITTELKHVVETQNSTRLETSKLINALRAAPKTRGRWGEQTLRNVIELAQLSQHCDFATEETFERDGSKFRPDAIINLPGERKLVIDAKTPLSAYLDAVDAVDDTERERLLVLHAKQVKDHIKQLASKEYWDNLTVTPDFVIMFIPGDNFYTAAVERDPSLFENAVKQSVVIVTPATLIALARAVAFGWRQEKLAEKITKIHDAGRELYKRLKTMSGHIGSCGDAIANSVKHFNKLIGSLEQNVMPQARKFNELEVEGTTEVIEEIEPIELEPRRLQSKDFVEQEDKIGIKAL